MLKNGDLLAGLFFMVVGIGCVIGALGLPLGTPLDPQPGFFPFVAGIFLSGLSIIQLVRSFLKPSVGTEKFGTLRRPIFLIAGLGIYSMILDLVGYVIATIVLTMIILWILESRSWWRLIAISLAASIGSYVLFDRILGVTLPLGIFKGVL